MLDAVILGANFFRRDIERLCKRFRNPREPAHHLQPLARKTWHPQGIKKFCGHARPRIARDRDVIDITDPNAGGVQAVANRRRRKPCRIFDAVKAFFLDGGD